MTLLASSPPSTLNAALTRVLYTRLLAAGRLRQLQLLVAMDDNGSIARAAALIPMSQSAATQALAELERLADMKLFERHARGVRATMAGRALIASARATLGHLLEAAEGLAAIQQGSSATLKLGAIPAANYSLISPLLKAFFDKHPDVHVDLQEDTGARLLPQLAVGNLNAVFCREPKQLPTGLTFEALRDDQAVVVAAATHPLAHQQRVSLLDLADAQWVLPTASIQLREVFESQVLSALPGAHWLPLSTQSLPVIEGLLQQPGAVALVPQSLSGSLLASGRLCCLPGVLLLAYMSPLGVAYLETESGRNLLQSLLSFARQQKRPTRAVFA